MYQRQHFEHVARVLAEQQPKDGSAHTTHAQWMGTVLAFANAFEQFNPNFKRAAFLKAAGVDDGA